MTNLENVDKPSPTEINKNKERKGTTKKNYTNQRHYRPEVTFWYIFSLFCVCVYVFVENDYLYTRTPSKSILYYLY